MRGREQNVIEITSARKSKAHFSQKPREMGHPGFDFFAPAQEMTEAGHPRFYWAVMVTVELVTLQSVAETVVLCATLSPLVVPTPSVIVDSSAVFEMFQVTSLTTF